MKPIAIIAAALLAATTRADIDLALPDPIPTGEQIVSARITFHAPILEISKPWINPADGRFGRLVRESDVRVILLNQHGEDVRYSQVHVYGSDPGIPGELKITGQELDAAGTELGIDWATSLGVDQLRVEMRAALRAIIGRLSIAEPYQTGMIEQIEARMLQSLGFGNN